MPILVTIMGNSSKLQGKQKMLSVFLRKLAIETIPRTQRSKSVFEKCFLKWKALRAAGPNPKFGTLIKNKCFMNKITLY